MNSMASNLKEKDFSSRLPKYKIDSLFYVPSAYYIGCGKFGAVLKCYQDILRTVAVKCFEITGSLKNQKEVRARVRQEANILSRVRHPNIVQILGITSWKNNVGILMEFVDGHNLKHILLPDNMPELPWKVRLEMGQQLLGALSYLHNYDDDKQFCHGDLKPENIMLTQNLQIKLTDFGGAKIICATGALSSSWDAKESRARTTIYAAPELLREPSRKLVPSMDMYSVGIIFYEIITRTEAFSDCDPRHVEQSIKQGWKPTQLKLEAGSTLIFRQDDAIFDLFSRLMETCWNDDEKARPSSSDVEKELSNLLKSVSGAEIERDIRMITTKDTSSSPAVLPVERCHLKDLSYPYMPDDGNLTSTDSDTSSSESCDSSRTLTPLTNTLRLEIPAEDVEMEHSADEHGFVLMIPKPLKRLSRGSACLYSCEGSFQWNHLWKIVVKPTISVWVEGKVEKTSLEGDILPSEWHEVEKVLRWHFTGTSRVAEARIHEDLNDVENEAWRRAESIAFTLDGGRFVNSVQPVTIPDRMGKSVTYLVQTGSVKRYPKLTCVFGVLELAKDVEGKVEFRFPTLLQAIVRLGKVFDRRVTTYASYCDRSEDWKTFAGISPFSNAPYYQIAMDSAKSQAISYAFYQ